MCLNFDLGSVKTGWSKTQFFAPLFFSYSSGFFVDAILRVCGVLSGWNLARSTALGLFASSFPCDYEHATIAHI